MNELTTTLISILAPVAATAVSGLVSWGLYELARLVRSKTDNAVVNSAVGQVARTVDAVTRELSQTMLPVIKAASADGRIGERDARFLKEAALSRVKSQLPKHMVKAAGKMTADIDEMIKTEIEKAVAAQKHEGRGTKDEG